MKYVYILIMIALAAGAYFLFVADGEQNSQEAEVSDGFHMMPDGTMMRNADMEAVEQPSASADSEQTSPVADGKVFSIKGVNHRFDLEEIRVSKGDTVTINFESDEGFHDWVVDEFDAATDRVQPGTPTSVTFVAEDAGTFEYYCSVGNHRANGMRGTLIVE